MLRMRKILAWALAALMVIGWAAAEEAEILYAVEVDLTNQVVTVYEVEGREEENIVRQMICSGGTEGNDATPLGEFKMMQIYAGEREEWYWIQQYQVYVQYPTRFNGPILFHSIPFAEKDLDTIDQEALEQLGEPVSHGCVRLRSEDAKWIAQNCPNGTTVRVYESEERDELLRKQLLLRGYVAEDWASYEAYLDANLAAEVIGGLVGAVEALDYD